MVRSSCRVRGPCRGQSRRASHGPAVDWRCAEPGLRRPAQQSSDMLLSASPMRRRASSSISWASGKSDGGRECAPSQHAMARMLAGSWPVKYASFLARRWEIDVGFLLRRAPRCRCRSTQCASIAGGELCLARQQQYYNSTTTVPSCYPPDRRLLRRTSLNRRRRRRTGDDWCPARRSWARQGCR